MNSTLFFILKLFSLLNKGRFLNHWKYHLRESLNPKDRVKISKVLKVIPITNPSPPSPASPPLHILNYITGKILSSLPILNNLLFMETI